MNSFLQRLLPGLFGATTERRQPAPMPAAALPSAGAAATTTAPVALGVRRPLIGAGGAIVGFEFRISEDVLRRLRRRVDHRGQAAYVSAVLASAQLMAQSGRIGFARVPADWLAHLASVEGVAGIWVGIEQMAQASQDPALLQVTAQAVQRLQAAGAKVGWDVTSVLALTPDFVLLCQRSIPMVALLAAVKTWPLALRMRPIVVTDVANAEALELALEQGIAYACGAMATAEVAGGPKDVLPVPPEIGRIGHLLKQLVSGAETALIVSDLKGDVGLSYRLLRRINSASFAQLNAGASIDQAVLMLGRNELYRWLSLLLVQFAGRRKAASALQEIALWRSRLLELLAVECQEAVPSQLFTLGLASLLGPILKISQEDVVSTLNLPAPARQALLEQAGPWYVYLQMAEQVEAAGLDEAGALADQFGGSARVQALSDEAWAWAWAAGHADREGAHCATLAT
jgi:EAL and modified HD-GYP domain-containing signal transduction protein